MKPRNKKQVLYLSPLPPPAGGIASWMEKVIRHGLPDGYIPRLVDTRIRGSRPVFGDAALSGMEAYRTVSIIGNLIARLSTSCPAVAHINSSLSPGGVFRELICAVLIRLRGTPLVTHFHGNMAAFPQDRLGRLCFRALRLLTRISSVNLVLNKASQELCLKLINDQNNGRCLLLPNFIEDAVFQRGTADNRAKSSRIRLVFVGGLTRAKGAMDMVELARHLPKYDFNLIGHTLPDFTPTLNTLPSNVSIVGSLPYEEVIEHIASCDLFVFPSHMEGFPLAVLEAMSVALPVVASSVGAIPDMIEEGKGGFLFEPGDIEGFASAIMMLAEDPALRERQGQFNLKKSQGTYSYSVVSKQLTSVYARVAERHHH